jgi:phospholipase C
VKRSVLVALAVTVLAAGGATVGLLLTPDKGFHPRFPVTAKYSRKRRDPQLPKGIHRIRHIIIVMQENRSFDEYFGTFPGADGLPRKKNGSFAVCVPNPAMRSCTRPFHDPSDRNIGAFHSEEMAKMAIDGGEMDGFIRVAQLPTSEGCSWPDVHCQADPARPDLMGFHDDREIPNYWTYAKRFVLQDHMFSAMYGPSLPAHLYLVSAWSARCYDANPLSCRSSLGLVKDIDPDTDPGHRPDFSWTDITYLLHKEGVSWNYYVSPKTVFDCDDGFEPCSGDEDANRIKGTPEQRNPLVDFLTVHKDHEVHNVKYYPDFFKAARKGTLASVVWVVPNVRDSDHPEKLVSDSQAWVTRVVNAVSRGPNWKDSAIFVVWDEWGGFYDHVPPPEVDGNGYGIRVPAFMVSPYAKAGMIDHQTLSFDAYLKFIEDVFLGGQRLDPKNDGRPDSRPTVRENVPILGDLTEEFDFNQKPLPPVILKPYPKG